jgi:hypothetical protein
MRVSRFVVSRRLPRVAVFSSALLASVALSATSFAAVPVGWSPTSSVDGGTSSIGSSIATTDAIAAVGAPFAAATSGGTPTGAVFVYSNAGGTWTSQRVAAPTPIDNGNFGTSVAASGSLLAVGAAGTPPAAYVFGADGGTYASLQTWTDPASDKNASFGGSVAVLEGENGTSYVAVSAPPGSSNPNGIVYVSREVGGAWSSPVELSDPSATAFGISVGFAGNGDLLVGDPGTGAGQVLVYAPEADGGWAPEGTLPFALDGGTVQQFGNAVATWNNVAVVTAPSSANAAGTYNGAVFVFEADDAGVWQQQAVLTGAAAESFGNFAPAVSSGFIAVGSAINTSSSGAGQVDVWAQSGGDWVSVPSSALVGDSYYGQAVGVVGSALFVGDTSAAGAASVSDVTSSLYIDTAVYADAGSSGDATVGLGDGSAPLADGAVASPDGSSNGSGGDAATGSNGDGGGAGEPASGATSSSGCSCTSGVGSDPDGLFALFAESGLVLLAWTRRRARATTASRRSC